MTRYQAIVEYFGEDFAGWQRQPDRLTVQEAIENALSKFYKKKINVVCAGRTDAGVHALGQVIHFDIENKIDPFKLMASFNFFIRPHKIVFKAVTIVDNEFHARFSAKKRSYVYQIINRSAPLAVMANRAWHVPVKLDVEAMRKASQYMVGRHDFTSFRDSQCQAKSAIKDLESIKIEQVDDQINIYVSAKSFLHHMVRNITGTLKLVGEGKWSPQHVEQILKAKDRTVAGPTVPPYGLYFLNVDY